MVIQKLSGGIRVGIKVLMKDSRLARQDQFTVPKGTPKIGRLPKGDLLAGKKKIG
jgi:hypothetical protein